MSSLCHSSCLPRFWEILSKDDQASYLNLRAELSNGAHLSKIGSARKLTSKKTMRTRRSIDMFNILDAIKAFIVQFDGLNGAKSDWKRSLVCGLFFIDAATIACCLSQFRILLPESYHSKATIHGIFQLAGFINCPEISNETYITESIPELAEIGEARNWTVKKNINIGLQNISLNLNNKGGHHQNFDFEDYSPAPEISFSPDVIEYTDSSYLSVKEWNSHVKSVSIENDMDLKNASHTELPNYQPAFSQCTSPFDDPFSFFPADGLGLGFQ